MIERLFRNTKKKKNYQQFRVIDDHWINGSRGTEIYYQLNFRRLHIDQILEV